MASHLVTDGERVTREKVEGEEASIWGYGVLE